MTEESNLQIISLKENKIFMLLKYSLHSNKQKVPLNFGRKWYAILVYLNGDLLPGPGII